MDGRWEEALELLTEMQESGVRPNLITFTGGTVPSAPSTGWDRVGLDRVGLGLDRVGLGLEWVGVGVRVGWVGLGWAWFWCMIAKGASFTGVDTSPCTSTKIKVGLAWDGMGWVWV